jgi:hypothetical protein
LLTITGRPCLNSHSKEAKGGAWGLRTRHEELFSRNSSQVNDAERRLAGQHVFIERLRASGNDICSAEKALEVMRDILPELYSARSLLRRKGVPRKGALDVPLRIRKAGNRR